ncbi:MAG: exopolysaccharide biosynthesis polyprenyl glycosylphosphotransferase [Patescibacteria group bacterium]|nr:exopolysaccharide biosynthesis polyprenyl glycosylphosphotransferase [Patescibacteria group bacterium]
MNNGSRFKQLTLIIGDIGILYASLLLTLWFRYGKFFYAEFINAHVQPFTIIFIFWIVIFYIAGLYDLQGLKNNFEFEKRFWYTTLVNILLTALFFYANPSFAITPKTNLGIFVLVFGCVNYLWRTLFNALLGRSEATNHILLVGANQTAQEIVDYLQQNPQLGYRVGTWMKEGLHDKEFNHLAQIILSENITTIVIPAHIKKDAKSAKLIYKCLVLGVEIVDLARMYEIVFQKVPLAELEEVWFLENLSTKHKIYESVSNPIERLLALLLGVVLLPLLALIAVIIKLTSPGSAFFSQRRVGRNEQEFTIWKFRTMRADAEKDGPQWANYFNDPRVTWFGNILRKSHLDELPQLYNIIRGELSFVGPRPERPEFVEKLRKELPYYDLRHLTKPGITGWAQINYRYAASATDAYQKLQYDIYYIKNNSLLLDLVIIIRTIKFLVTNHD